MNSPDDKVLEPRTKLETYLLNLKDLAFHNTDVFVDTICPASDHAYNYNNYL